MKKILDRNLQLIKDAKSGRFVPHGVLAVIIVTLILLVSQLLVIPLVLSEPIVNLHQWIGDAAHGAIFGLTLPYAAIALMMFAWVKWAEKRSIRSLGFIGTKVLRKYLLGFLVGLGLISLMVLVLAVIGMLTLNQLDKPGIVGITALPAVMTLLLAWIVQGAVEEIVLRGYLLPVLSARHNVWIGLIISSILFGVLHIITPEFTILSLINLVLFGLFAGLFVFWEGSIWGVCGIHAAWNWMQGNGFGIAVSGSGVRGGALLNFDAVEGFDLFSGGAYGLEGGLICTLLLVAGIVVMVVLLRRRK